MQAVEIGIKVDEEAAKSAHSAEISSEIPESLVKFSANEKKVWNYLTHALDQYDLIHLTDSIMISMICKTFCAWIDAEKELANHVKVAGSIMVETPNGFQQPHQLFFAVRALKKELKELLPDAVLTIPSFQKVMGERVVPKQKELFVDPVAEHRKMKAKIGMQLIKNGEQN